MSTIAASLIFGALILKLVDLVKYLVNFDWNGLGTLMIGWVAGVGAIEIIIRATDWGSQIKIGSEGLDKLDFPAQLVLGFVATSIAAVLYDFKKAVDNTDTASTPRLGTSSEEERKRRVEAALPQEIPPA